MSPNSKIIKLTFMYYPDSATASKIANDTGAQRESQLPEVVEVNPEVECPHEHSDDFNAYLEPTVELDQDLHTQVNQVNHFSPKVTEKLSDNSVNGAPENVFEIGQGEEHKETNDSEGDVNDSIE